MDAFEYKGYWWLPDHEAKKYPGTLSFSHGEGLLLEIFGSFSLELQVQYPIIKGKTLEGKHFTVFDCASQHSKVVEPPDYVQEDLSAEYAFESVVVGLGKTPPDSYSFHKAFVQYTYLPDWVGRTDFQLTENFDEITEKIDELELVYKTSEKLSADLGSAKISVVEGFNVSDGNRAIQGVGIRPIFVFEIEAEQELSFEDWREKFVGPLGDFLTLATGQPNAVAKLSFHSRLNNSDSSDDGSKVSKTTAYYSQITPRVSRKASVLRDQDMLFGFQDIKDEHPQIIQDWLTSREKFANSMMLFFAIKNSGKMYLEHEFLSLVQALETFHRELQANYDKRVWLIKRVSELLEYSEPVISRLITNRAVFAKKVKCTRNFLTHYSEKSEYVMEEIELYRATQVLSYVFQTCIMLELGISEEKIISLFERNENFMSTRRYIEQAGNWK